MRLALGLTAIVAVSLWLLPQWAPVQAEAWQPPPNPGLTGVFAPNQALSAIAEIAVGPAPEHVACDAEGRLYTSLEGGAVLRREQDGELAHHRQYQRTPFRVESGRRGWGLDR